MSSPKITPLPLGYMPLEIWETVWVEACGPGPDAYRLTWYWGCQTEDEVLIFDPTYLEPPAKTGEKIGP